MAVTLDRLTTPRGELVLRQDGEYYEVISNGTFLMDTRNGESERLLVSAALSRVSVPQTVLIGGLGVGFSLVEALRDERVTHVTVVEIESTICSWHERFLTGITGEARRDHRTDIVIADVADVLRSSPTQYDAICLDVDNGPEWTVTADNAGLYGDAGTALLARRLRPGGVLTVWSAARSPAYEGVLARHFGKVEVVEVPVARGEPDVVFAATKAVAQTLGRDSDSS